MPADRPPDARPAGPDVCPEVAGAFAAATATAFEELAQTPPIPGEPYLTRAAAPAGWVTAEIALRRSAEGRVVVAFPRPVLEALAGRYLAGGPPLTPDLVDDAAGEFANVIAGQAKTMLKGTLYHFTLSTPRVGRAAGGAAGDADYLTLPFDTDAGGFTVAVDLPACADESPAAS